MADEHQLYTEAHGAILDAVYRDDSHELAQIFVSMQNSIVTLERRLAALEARVGTGAES